MITTIFYSCPSLLLLFLESRHCHLVFGSDFGFFDFDELLNQGVRGQFGLRSCTVQGPNGYSAVTFCLISKNKNNSSKETRKKAWKRFDGMIGFCNAPKPKNAHIYTIYSAGRRTGEEESACQGGSAVGTSQSVIVRMTERFKTVVQIYLRNSKVYNITRRPGRPSSLTPATLRRTIRAAQISRYSSSQLVRSLDLTISACSACDVLAQEDALRYVKRKSSPVLKKAHKLARLEWVSTVSGPQPNRECVGACSPVAFTTEEGSSPTSRSSNPPFFNLGRD